MKPHFVPSSKWDFAAAWQIILNYFIESFQSQTDMDLESHQNQENLNQNEVVWKNGHDLRFSAPHLNCLFSSFGRLGYVQASKRKVTAWPYMGSTDKNRW